MASANGRRRARRNTQPLNVQTSKPREVDINWALVSNTSYSQPPPASSPYVHYPMSEAPVPRSVPPPVAYDRYAYPQSDSSSSRERNRYAPYPPGNVSPVVPTRRPSTAHSLSLDIPSLSLEDRERSQPRSSHLQIMLPPVQPPKHDPQSPALYALPPISALEDLRGVHTHDSTAVLRRLQEDDTFSRSSQEFLPTTRRWSLSVPNLK